MEEGYNVMEEGGRRRNDKNASLRWWLHAREPTRFAKRDFFKVVGVQSVQGWVRSLNRKPKLQVANGEAAGGAEQEGAAVRQVAANFLITSSGDAAAASAAVTEWSSKPPVRASPT